MIPNFQIIIIIVIIVWLGRNRVLLVIRSMRKKFLKSQVRPTDIVYGYSKPMMNCFNAVVFKRCFIDIVEGVCSPDGGTTNWNGYVVVQAKYLAQPTTTKEDLEWLKGQIDKDLTKFQDKRRNLRAPEYYVVVTNVTLTGGAANIDGKRGGSLDAMREHLKTWSSKIGIKDFYIWDRNVLSRFLDAESELRNPPRPRNIEGRAERGANSKLQSRYR